MERGPVLVTGGAGFIGSHLVEALLTAGHRVRVVDDLSTGRRENLPAADVELLAGDVRDESLLRRALVGIEVVFHEAALLSVPRSIEDPFAYHDVNVTGTLRLLLAARAAGVRRVVVASSSAVYGDHPAPPLHEALRPEPVSPYGANKLAGEHYCALFARHYGLEAVALRYFNVYGSRQDPASAYAAVVARFGQAALAGVPLEVHGDGLQTRDFVHVDDVVAANLLAAAAPGASGLALNVASGHRRSVLDIVRALEHVLGRSLPLHHTPARAGDVRDSWADTTRARDVLGFRPQVGFDEGLRRTLAAVGG